MAAVDPLRALVRPPGEGPQDPPQHQQRQHKRHAHAELIWAKVNNAPSPEAIAAAKNVDAVIAVVGITSQLEGEEMPVSEPGFLGGDRTSIDLPQPERNWSKQWQPPASRLPWFS